MGIANVRERINVKEIIARTQAAHCLQQFAIRNSLWEIRTSFTGNWWNWIIRVELKCIYLNATAQSQTNEPNQQQASAAVQLQHVCNVLEEVRIARVRE